MPRRALLIALALALALVLAVTLTAVLVARDEATTAPPAGPGVLDERARSAALRAGNVELRHGRAADRAALVALARRLAGAADPALERAGQAVLVVRDPGVAGVLARAWRRSLRASSPADPRLQEFVDAWLGRGAHR